MVLRPFFMRVWLYTFLLLAGLVGCGAPALRPEAPPEVRACLEFLRASDEAVQEAGVRDAQATRVPGFPYLRVNRFLASFSKDNLQGPRFQAWIEQMQTLEVEGRDKEYRALSATQRAGLSPGSPSAGHLLTRARSCGDQLGRFDLAEARARMRLVNAAQVPPDYSRWQRVLGLYPLTSLVIFQGVLRYHHEVAMTYATPLDNLPVKGRLIRFTPPPSTGLLASSEVARILRRSADNPLRIPKPQGEDQRRLFATFAPVWEVDVAGETDRIGMPYWGRAAEVNTGEPVVLTHLSHGRLGAEVLLQLNYIIWFPARPRTGPFDLLGGRLDGIIWRVTLGADGRPLIYDSVHNCGCYHRFFPTPRLRLVRRHVGFEEPILVPQRIPLEQSRKVLRVASTSHYVQRVQSAVGNAATGKAEVVYRFRDYDELRALPVADGHRSLFGPDGIVPDTERRERCLLWPTGVDSPGSMRQWGRHAVAFVGERHFDAPELIERYFEVLPEGAGGTLNGGLETPAQPGMTPKRPRALRAPS